MPSARVAPPLVVPIEVRSLSTFELTAKVTKLAKCQDYDPELWFPVSQVARPAAEEDAEYLCAGCPVQVECLELALRLGVLHGVWGGTREWQREHLLIQRADERRRGDDGTGRLAVAA